MKRFLPAILPFLFCACSADIDSQLPDLPLSSEAISLYSGIGSITAGQTRGDGIATLAADLPVAFVRTDKLSGGSYPSTYANLDTLRATVKATTGQIAFGRTQYYLANGGNTKFAGWYPRSGTWNNTNGTVTFTIDGTTDILASTTGEGNNQSLFSTTQHTLTFNHVLTQINVFAYLENSAYQAVWGNLTGITLANKAQTCTLTLPATDADEGTSPTASFGTSTTALALQKLNNSGAAVTTSAPLTLSATVPNTAEDTPIGYAMFAPHTGSGSEKLILNVTTANGGTQPVEITYNDMKLKPGNTYNVVLKFQAVTISASATLTDWVTAPSGEQPPTVGIGG